jgi:hypothetical protein
VKPRELWLILSIGSATFAIGALTMSFVSARAASRPFFAPLVPRQNSSVPGSTGPVATTMFANARVATPQSLSAPLALGQDASVPGAKGSITPTQGSKVDPKSEKRDAQAIARQLEESFRKQGIHLDLERHLCWIPVRIDIRDDLLEYLLVNPKGAAHESLFVTDVVPSVLQTALLALGVEPGKNAEWKARTPPPTAEEMRAGIAPYTVDPPEGDGFLLYAAWREKGETFFYRVDDLLRDLETGRSMRRHRWVYLGSRWVTRKESGEKAFVADLECNLVNIALFEQGNTLITAALPECLKQTVWRTNAWLVPARGAEVALIFARERLAALPPELESKLPEVVPEPEPKADPRDGR